MKRIARGRLRYYHMVYHNQLGITDYRNNYSTKDIYLMAMNKNDAKSEGTDIMVCLKYDMFDHWTLRNMKEITWQQYVESQNTSHIYDILQEAKEKLYLLHSINISIQTIYKAMQINMRDLGKIDIDILVAYCKTLNKAA